MYLCGTRCSPVQVTEHHTTLIFQDYIFKDYMNLVIDLPKPDM